MSYSSLAVAPLAGLDAVDGAAHRRGRPAACSAQRPPRARGRSRSGTRGRPLLRLSRMSTRPGIRPASAPSSSRALIRLASAWISSNSSPETSMLTAAPVGGPPWSWVTWRVDAGQPRQRLADALEGLGRLLGAVLVVHHVERDRGALGARRAAAEHRVAAHAHARGDVLGVGRRVGVLPHQGLDAPEDLVRDPRSSARWWSRPAPRP